MLLEGLQQTKAADELRQRVCEELLARRSEVEPFIDEDFDAYIVRMGRPATWGGAHPLVLTFSCGLKN
jgi:OTU-like cysteine protease